MMAAQWGAAKRFKAAGGKAVGKGGDADATGSGEIRFEDTASAGRALQKLNGSMLMGSPISLAYDPTSKDMTKLIVSGLPSHGVEWQELKDHFASIGNVAFAIVNGAVPRGPKLIGEVRFETNQAAQQALATLQGTALGGARIEITLDPSSKDGTKLTVSNLKPGTAWQELKDHFAQVGLPIAYVGVSSGSSAGGGGSCLCFGEVRYHDPEHAKLALTTMNGTMLDGSQIFVQTSPNSFDGCKLMVQGLSPKTQWQELKDHFASQGPVAHADVASLGHSMAALQPMMGMMGGMPMAAMMNMNFAAFSGLFSKGKKGGKGGKKGGGKAIAVSNQECWDMKAKGSCPRGAKCKWCHPA